jgi:hypothetical protein
MIIILFHGGVFGEIRFSRKLRSLLGRPLLTMDNLRKHLIVVNWCYMYKNSGESVDYLLLLYHWTVAYDYLQNPPQVVGN